MSKLEELINELCPNGVEYVSLKNIAIMQRGTAITKANITEGDIPVVAGGKTPAYYCNTFNRSGETITISGSGAYAGYVAFWDIPIFVSDAFSIKGTERARTKYLYYFLQSKQDYIYGKKKGGGIPHVHISDVDELQIPLPPLAVQREIVRVLDEFTLLSAELAAELAARKKQYNFYRDKLLQNVNGVAFVRLCDITDKIERVKWNNNLQLNYIDLSSVNVENNSITQTAVINKDNAPSRAQQLIKTNDILFGTTRPMLKRITYVNNEYDGQVCSTGFCVVRVRCEFVNPKWVYYQMSSEKFYNYVEQYQEGASYPCISDDKVKQYYIPLPSIEEQNRIVVILDRFDKLCNDISEGLPAEIEARQKQYEYYRDKLLQF